MFVRKKAYLFPFIIIFQNNNLISLRGKKANLKGIFLPN